MACLSGCSLLTLPNLQMPKTFNKKTLYCYTSIFFIFIDDFIGGYGNIFSLRSYSIQLLQAIFNSSTQANVGKNIFSRGFWIHSRLFFYRALLSNLPIIVYIWYSFFLIKARHGHCTIQPSEVSAVNFK